MSRGGLSTVDRIAEVNRAIGRVGQRELYQAMSRSRYSCESRWMMAAVLAAGWEKANELNRQVARDVAVGDMRRLMELMNWRTPGNEEEFLVMAITALELLLPKKYFEYEVQVLEDGSIHAIVHSCLACTKVKSIGVQDMYECGCFSMRAGWYEAMGIEVEETLLECILNDDERCEILVVPRGLQTDSPEGTP